jgi:hypothetical protein
LLIQTACNEKSLGNLTNMSLPMLRPPLGPKVFAISSQKYAPSLTILAPCKSYGTGKGSANAKAELAKRITKIRIALFIIFPLHLSLQPNLSDLTRDGYLFLKL